MNINIYNRLNVKDSQLFNRIIDLDKENMLEIFTNTNKGFPIEKRIKSFELDGKVIVATRNEKLIGYLEYGNSWENPEDIYISSLQIRKENRGGKLFLYLLLKAQEDLKSSRFRYLISGVHVSNLKAINLYKKLGFSIENNQNTSSSYKVIATPTILDNNLINKLNIREIL
ncbi:MAG: GNAT family N-acetyltransferase [Ignavibacteria bacterium]|jgi:ribosomal protein S18 acetylase RimI-like enzyme